MSSRDPYDDRYNDDRDRDRDDDRGRDGGRDRSDDRDPDAYDDVRDDSREARRERLRRRARDKVGIPALFLIIFGLIALALAVMNIALLWLNPDLLLKGWYEFVQENFPQQKQPPYEEYVKEQQRFATVVNAIRIVLSVLIVVGGMKMRSLEGYGLALAASIIAIIPVCANECCCTLPFGIWSLVVLLGADVKRAFSLGSAPGGF